MKAKSNSKAHHPNRRSSKRAPMIGTSPCPDLVCPEIAVHGH
jgi:hypothetical protein